MSEKMKHFMMVYGIEIPQEIDTNPFYGLTDDEIAKIQKQLELENLLYF
ncbi:hypothetical protein J1N10_10565 [Carboxylicivirga sp. A043]|nr:hypothetical protein [Carboxylicivirga sp. A043]MCU4156422.1 hypothetical protein [Carboxylicivirga sp. A043]